MKNRKAMLAFVLSAAMTVTSAAPVFAAEWQDTQAEETAVEVQTEEATEAESLEEADADIGNVIDEEIAGEDTEAGSPAAEVPAAESTFDAGEALGSEDVTFSDGSIFSDAAEGTVSEGTADENLKLTIKSETTGNALTAVWFYWDDISNQHVKSYKWDAAEKKWYSSDSLGALSALSGIVAVTSTQKWNLDAEGSPASGYYWNEEASRYEYYLSAKETDELKGSLLDTEGMALPAEIYAGAGADMTKHCGLQIINQKTYFLNEDGTLLKNDGVVIEGKKYVFGEDGVLTKSFKYYNPGWVTTKGEFKWRQEDGSYYTKKGWADLGGKRYYINSDGTCKTGWLTWKSGRYYLSTSTKKGTHGAVYMGLKTVSGKKYLFDSKTGVALYGKQKVSGKYYYFAGNGIMVTSKTGYKIGTKYYRISSKGVLTTVSEVEGLAGIRYDKQGRKLSAAFKWSSSIKYYAGSALPKASDVDACAVYGFKNGKGDCYVMAATFCWMAKVAGYDEVYYVRGSVPLAAGGSGSHSWCEIVQSGKTYVYDPNLASTYGSGGYKFSYGDKGTYKYNDKRTKTKIGK